MDTGAFSEAELPLREVESTTLISCLRSWPAILLLWEILSESRFLPENFWRVSKLTGTTVVSVQLPAMPRRRGNG